MKKFTGHVEPWGKFVDIKVNAPELLPRELRTKPPGKVMLSSVTDPYQPIEAEVKLTRSCLEILVNSLMRVNILTKSNLVVRDLDILRKLNEVTVGITLTTDDEKVRRIFEPFSPGLNERLEALRVLHENHISNYAFIGPLLPANPTRLAQLIAPVVDEVLIDRVNYAWKVRALYETHGLAYALDEGYVTETQSRLVEKLERLGVPACVV